MEYFKSVCIRLNVSDTVVVEWCEKIKSQYEQRAYHNLEMLSQKIKVAKEEFPENESLYHSLVFASFFQYYHFDVKTDKSEDNCEEFKRFVEQAKIDNTELVDATLRMLQEDSDDSEEISIFKDLDLIVLGSSEEEYQKYRQGMQDEFFTNEAYKRDRLKTLKTLLTIPFIYSNQKIRDRFEGAARNNIKMEIESLES